MRWTRGVLLLGGAALFSCGGDHLPKEVTFEGAKLEKASGWSNGGLSGVVFIPPGEKLETASLQVGVIESRDHDSGAALHAWLMDQYRRSPTTQWHESATSDEACKVGLTATREGVVRPFVALHVCRSGSGRSACAEADEMLSEEITGRCVSRGSACWDEVCTQKWGGRRAPLEAIVNSVAR